MKRRGSLTRVVRGAGAVVSTALTGPVLGATATFLALGGAAQLAVEARPETYQAQSIVAFVPRDPATAGAETMVLVTPRYVELLRNPSVVAQASDQTGAVLLGDRVSGVIEPNTLNLQVQVEAGDPQRAADAADLLAAVVVREAAADDLLSAELVAPAVAPDEPATPTPRQLGLLGWVAGAAAAVGVLLVGHRLRVRRQA